MSQERVALTVAILERRRLVTVQRDLRGLATATLGPVLPEGRATS